MSTHPYRDHVWIHSSVVCQLESDTYIDRDKQRFVVIIQATDRNFSVWMDTEQARNLIEQLTTATVQVEQAEQQWLQPAETDDSLPGPVTTNDGERLA